MRRASRDVRTAPGRAVPARAAPARAVPARAVPARAVPARAVLSRLSGRAGGAVTAAAAVLALTVALVSGAGAAAAAASPVHDHHGPSARPEPAVHTPGAPRPGQPPAHRGRTAPPCRG